MVRYDEIYDQSITRTPSTSWACGATASCWAVNAANYEEGSDVYIDRVDAWNEQLAAWNAGVSSGSSMASWIEYMSENHVIGSWYIPETPEEVHIAMSKWHNVWSGSNQIDRSKTKWGDNYAVYGSSTWHFFALSISDSLYREFTWANSYWTNNYDEWYFHTKREDLNKLYTCIAFVDTQDIETIDKIENRLNAMIKERGQSAIRQLITKRRKNLTHAEKLVLWDKLVSM